MFFENVGYYEQSLVSNRDLVLGHKMFQQALLEQDLELHITALHNAICLHYSYFSIKELIKKFNSFIEEGSNDPQLSKLKIFLKTYLLNSFVDPSNDRHALIQNAKTFVESLTIHASLHGFPGYVLSAYNYLYLVQLVLMLKNNSTSEDSLYYSQQIEHSYQLCVSLLYAAQKTFSASEAEIRNACGYQSSEYNFFHDNEKFSRLIDHFYQDYYQNYTKKNALPQSVLKNDGEILAKFFLDKIDINRNQINDYSPRQS